MEFKAYGNRIGMAERERPMPADVPTSVGVIERIGDMLNSDIEFAMQIRRRLADLANRLAPAGEGQSGADVCQPDSPGQIPRLMLARDNLRQELAGIKELVERLEQL